MVFAEVKRIDKVFRQIQKRVNAYPDTATLAIFPAARSVDACLATRILLSLLDESVRCSIFPVSTSDDIIRFNDKETRCSFSTFVFLNCAGMSDLSKLLDFVSDKFDVRDQVNGKKRGKDSGAAKYMCYVIDPHRPLNLRNLFSYPTVVVMYDGDMDSELMDEKAAFETLFRQNARPAAIMEAQTVMAKYERTPRKQGLSSAMQMYYLARGLRKERIQFLFYGIVGFTSQYCLGFLAPDKYHALEREVRSELQRFVNISLAAEGNAAASQNAPPVKKKLATITHLNDFRFPLWRHWTLFESMHHSLSVATDLRLWRPQTEERLLQIFARAGISLKDARGPVSQLSSSAQDQLYNDDTFRKYEFPSFLHTGWGLSAADMAYALQAELDDGRALYSSAIKTARWRGVRLARDQFQLLVSACTAILQRAGTRIINKTTYLYADMNHLNLTLGHAIEKFRSNPLLMYRVATMLNHTLQRGIPMVLSLQAKDSDAIWVVCEWDIGVFDQDVLDIAANSVGALYEPGEEITIISLDDTRDLPGFLATLQETFTRNGTPNGQMDLDENDGEEPEE